MKCRLTYCVSVVLCFVWLLLGWKAEEFSQLISYLTLIQTHTSTPARTSTRMQRYQHFAQMWSKCNLGVHTQEEVCGKLFCGLTHTHTNRFWPTLVCCSGAVTVLSGGLFQGNGILWRRGWEGERVWPRMEKRDGGGGGAGDGEKDSVEMLKLEEERCWKQVVSQSRGRETRSETLCMKLGFGGAALTWTLSEVSGNRFGLWSLMDRLLDPAVVAPILVVTLHFLTAAGLWLFCRQRLQTLRDELGKPCWLSCNWKGDVYAPPFPLFHICLLSLVFHLLLTSVALIRFRFGDKCDADDSFGAAFSFVAAFQEWFSLFFPFCCSISFCRFCCFCMRMEVGIVFFDAFRKK